MFRKTLLLLLERKQKIVVCKTIQKVFREIYSVIFLQSTLESFNGKFTWKNKEWENGEQFKTIFRAVYVGHKLCFMKVGDEKVEIYFFGSP